MNPNQQPQQPRQPQPGSPAPTVGTISDFVASRPSAKPNLQPQYQPRQAAAQPAGTGPIAFHVPGARPDPKPIEPDDSQVTSFDRDAPPPVASRAINPTKKHGQGFRDILSITGVLVSALVLAFCLITFVFQSYQVDGPSMQSTLETNDHLIVWKVSKTIANVTNRAYIPNRGDVIVFSSPELSNYGKDSSKQLIKRVIGLPGEHVVYKGTDVFIYNKEHPEGFNPDKTLPYGNTLINQNPSNVDVTLGKDQIFVSGDHRDNSLDSRSFGPIDAHNIVGKLVVRVLPLNAVKRF